MPERKPGPVCQFCGYNTNPSTALFCVGCRELMKPEVFKPYEPLKFPRFMEVRTWLEGEPARKGFFGPYRRAFGISFVLMDAPRSVVVRDGTLRIRITGIFNKARFETEVRVRKEDFSTRRFDHMTLSGHLESYTFRHPAPEIPVPTDGGCRLELWFQADGGESYQNESEAWFFDKPPPDASVEPRSGQTRT